MFKKKSRFLYKNYQVKTKSCLKHLVLNMYCTCKCHKYFYDMERVYHTNALLIDVFNGVKKVDCGIYEWTVINKYKCHEDLSNVQKDFWLWIWHLLTL